MTTDVSLNGVSLAGAVPEAIILRPARPITGKRRDVFVDVPGRAGSWTFPEEPGDGFLELDIDIQGTDFATRRAAVRALAAWADVGSVSKLIVDDESDRYYDAILDRGKVDEWLVRGEITLRFRVGPYAYANGLSTENLSAVTNPDDDTFSIPDDVDALPIVEITPSGGDLASFSLTIAGTTTSWAGSILSGETLTISSISDTVTLGVNEDTMLTGAFDPNDLDMADVSGEFPYLVSGSNAWSFLWTGTATSVAIVVTWRRRYP